MAKQRRTTHGELAELRQQAAAERMKQRDAEAALEAAKAAVEDASRGVADAYAQEDAKLAAQRRKELEATEADVLDLQHRVTAAGLRVDRAQGAADSFTQQHARDLLEERAADARELAMQLTRAGHDVVRLHRGYRAMRTDIDALVAATPGATPRADGPDPSHPWERQLRDLERVVKEHPEVPAPTPRWGGLGQRQQQDQVARREQLRRQPRRTEQDQADIDRINLELGANPPTVEVT